VMIGRFAHSTMNSFFGNMEAGMCATVTPPYKNPVNQIVDRNSTVNKLVSALHLADPLPCA
jgi:hypothetical protein